MANANTVIAWDPVTVDTVGNPKTIDHYVVSINPPQHDLNAAGTYLQQEIVPAPTTSIDLAVLAAGLSDGSYGVQVQAVDNQGNASTWSSPVLVINMVTTVPATPENVREE